MRVGEKNLRNAISHENFIEKWRKSVTLQFQNSAKDLAIVFSRTFMVSVYPVHFVYSFCGVIFIFYICKWIVLEKDSGGRSNK